jgi:hypothetical protein
LKTLRRFRTYIGVSRTRARLAALLERGGFVRACDVARRLSAQQSVLPRFSMLPNANSAALPS